MIGLLLVVGWLIWLWFSAKKSQSPAKQLLGMYVLTTDGQPASASRVWIREALLQWLIFANVFLAAVVDFLFFLFDENAQSLHDKIMETIVVRPVPQTVGSAPPTSDRDAPPAADAHTRQRKLRELEEMADKGLITVREYRDRRQRLLDEMEAE